MSDLISRADEYIPAVISGKRSEYDNCSCDMCHGLGYVSKIDYPLTKYYKTGNGNERKLSQKRYGLWLCDVCRKKLIDILEECDERSNQQTR